MIVAESADRYRFVTQPDHARMAGQFAARWGNDEFEPPEPRAPTVVAASTHDDGWWRYDRRPRLDEDGAPIGFREVPADAWIDIYDEGIDAVVEEDPLAGLLVSMHGTGLRRRRYGLSPSWPPTPPEYAGFVDRQESFQERLLAEVLSADDGYLSEVDADLLSALHESGEAPVGTDSRLWFDYRLLQAWDALSLSFCTAESPESSEIGAVPTGPGGADETLSVEPLGDDRYRVEPYPFGTSPLIASVPAKTVRKDAFDDDESVALAYFQAERETVSFALHRDGG